MRLRRLWPGQLAHAALEAIANRPTDNLKPAQLEALEKMRQGTMEAATVESKGILPGHAMNTALFIIEYADGFRGYTLMLPGFATDFAFAGRRVGGEIDACVCGLDSGWTQAHFSYLSRNIVRVAEPSAAAAIF